MGTLKNEVQHFTDAPEIQHFPVEKVSRGDNVYGVTWANVVRKFLETAYSEEGAQAEIVSDGVTYKVLKREKVTAFYDADGNTLFDVENVRLEKEYGYLMQETAADEPTVPVVAGFDEDREAAAQANEEAEKAAAVPAGDSRAEAIAKLDSELLRVEMESDKRFAEPCIDYLKKRCGEDAGICEDILQVHKTWKKCHSYIMAQARKELNNTSGPVRSDVVFEWAEDYFHLDDKALEEKRAREAAERKKRQEESKKQPAKGKQKAAVKKPEPGKPAGQPSGKQAEKLHPKKKAKEMEGQLDLFSMMGL